MSLKNNTKKITIKSIDDLNSLDYSKLMYPVIMYGKEKIENNMYDDWDEYKHTMGMINQLKQNLKEKQDLRIEIYCIEENNVIIGICFFIFGKAYMKKFLEKIEESNFNTIDNCAQLTCFHILKKYRGIGTKWIKEIVFPDLVKNSIKEIYVKSSHNKALHFYQKLGEQVGQYIGISDNQLYQRLGYIYKININKEEYSLL